LPSRRPSWRRQHERQAGSREVRASRHHDAAQWPDPCRCRGRAGRAGASRGGADQPGRLQPAVPLPEARAVTRVLVLHVAPHLEPGGYHRDRFDAFLGGELLHTGRQVVRPVARILLERGYPPETLLTMHAEGASGASFTPRPIAAWAGEKLVEKDRGGFRVEKW